MKRRSFLKLLAAIPGIALMPSLVGKVEARPEEYEFDEFVKATTDKVAKQVGYKSHEELCRPIKDKTIIWLYGHGPVEVEPFKPGYKKIVTRKGLSPKYWEMIS